MTVPFYEFMTDQLTDQAAKQRTDQPTNAQSE